MKTKNEILEQINKLNKDIKEVKDNYKNYDNPDYWIEVYEEEIRILKWVLN